MTTFTELPFIDRDDVRLPRWLRRMAARDQTERGKEPRWPSDFPTYAETGETGTGERYVLTEADRREALEPLADFRPDEHPSSVVIPEGGFGTDEMREVESERLRAAEIRRAMEGRR